MWDVHKYLFCGTLLELKKPWKPEYVQKHQHFGTYREYKKNLLPQINKISFLFHGNLIFNPILQVIYGRIITKMAWRIIALICIHGLPFVPLKFNVIRWCGLAFIWNLSLFQFQVTICISDHRKRVQFPISASREWIRILNFSSSPSSTFLQSHNDWVVRSCELYIIQIIKTYIREGTFS